jgi:hypothetical protein
MEKVQYIPVEIESAFESTMSRITFIIIERLRIKDVLITVTTCEPLLLHISKALRCEGFKNVNIGAAKSFERGIDFLMNVPNRGYFQKK